MERHVFKFGESSIAMVVPKGWADKNALKPKDSIYLAETDGGELIVSTKSVVKKNTDVLIESSTKPTIVGRWVGLHYIYGVSKIRIHSQDGITSQQLDAIEERINYDCAGFEITSQSKNDVIIEDFMDAKEVTMEKIVNRLRSLIGFEFKDMHEGNFKSVEKTEKIVNRFYMLGARHTYMTRPKDELKYFKLLELIEGISDKITEVSSEIDQKHTSIFEDLQRQFDESFLGLNGSLKSIESVARQRELIHKKLSSSRMDHANARLLKEVSDCISSIAEFGLRVD